MATMLNGTSGGIERLRNDVGKKLVTRVASGERVKGLGCNGALHFIYILRIM